MVDTRAIGKADVPDNSESIGKIGSYDLRECDWKQDGWTVSPESQWLSKWVMAAEYVFAKEQTERDLMLAVAKALSGNVRKFGRDAKRYAEGLIGIASSTPTQFELISLASDDDFENYFAEKAANLENGARRVAGLDPTRIRRQSSQNTSGS